MSIYRTAPDTHSSEPAKKFSGALTYVSEGSANPVPTGHEGTVSVLRYVARQPILDLRGRIHGYELLYRKGVEPAFQGDGELASRTILDDAVIFGVERYTGGSLAFINCTSEVLTEDLVRVLPSNLAVLELLESVEPSPQVIEACEKLKALGFRFALDDFVWAPDFAPLLELADYIKVDFLATDPDQRRNLRQKLKGHSALMVAEKVETHEAYQKARLEGFTYFQGYYFCRPQLIVKRKIAPNQLRQFEIMRLLQDSPINWDKLNYQVKRDESLTYRLLRFVNSAGCGVRAEITSVRSAMVLLGEDAFRRLAMLAIATELNSGRTPEILKMAMVRARFCELAAPLCAFDSNEQYLLGMLSLLPAMLGVPMEEIARELPFRKEILEALQEIVNREGCLLEWLKLHECADWIACGAILEPMRIKQDQVSNCYAEAILWAENQFRFTD